MRYALNCVSTGDRQTPQRTVAVLNELYSLFRKLSAASRINELDKKLSVLLQSLVKVENGTAASLYLFLCLGVSSSPSTPAFSLLSNRDSVQRIPRRTAIERHHCCGGRLR
jgi:hypothetical protein